MQDSVAANLIVAYIVDAKNSHDVIPNPYKKKVINPKTASPASQPIEKKKLAKNNKIEIAKLRGGPFWGGPLETLYPVVKGMVFKSRSYTIGLA